jgi:DNA (cytosine-5)-methyltransferase 1
MKAILETIHSTASCAYGVNDFRWMKNDLFFEASKYLPSFSPLKTGSGNDDAIQIIDFFSGAGGTSLGFAAVNSVHPVFRFLAGCDVNPISASTYSRNFGTPVVCEDVVKISSSAESIQAFLNRVGFDVSKPSIMIGCAPCQGFTSHRKKRWDEEDCRNDLAMAFARIVSAAKPSAFVMENVPEFLSSKYWGYFSKAREIFLGAGYTVKQAILNAAQFGVPQERFRTIVIGMEKDFLLPEGIYEPSEYRTVRDAIGSLRPLASGGSDCSDALHKAVSHKRNTLEVIRKVPHDGGNLPEGEGPACLAKVKGFTDVYGRLPWDKPSITITHYARNPASGRYTHPEQDRGLTARESARLQSFPDGFVFNGKSDDIYRQIGEAVPPLLSCGVAASMLIELISREPEASQLESNDYGILSPVSNSYSSVIAGLKCSRRRA